MKIFALLLLLALTLCACRRYHRPGDIPSGAPKVVLRGSDECRREHDSAFSPREQQIIGAARRHLGQAGKRSIDAYYHLEHSSQGYEVFVIYVTGYDRSEPLFIAGGFCTVVLREDGTVIKVLGGT